MNKDSNPEPLMEEENKDYQDVEVIITDLEPSDERLYIYAVDGAFNVLQTTTGSLLRHARTNFHVLFPNIVNDRGYVSINAVDHVQIESGQGYSEIVSFNADNGSIIWRYPTFPPLSSPLFSDGNIYVNDIQGRVYALHAADGILLWHSE